MSNYPICCIHCNSLSIFSGCLVGTKCFNANFLEPSDNFKVAKYTELKVPSPTFPCTWNKSFINGTVFLIAILFSEMI